VVPVGNIDVYPILLKRYLVHEVSIMMSIMETALDVAQKNQAEKIVTISLVIGEKSGVVVDALEFAFEAVTRETIAEGATLDIDLIPFEGECNSCGHRFKCDRFIICEKCGSPGHMISGNELRIKSIEVE
jgi:hydrogenase nickel incorporation protein HypA/HybF